MTARTQTAPRVGIVMGSDSDLPVMREAAQILAEFGVVYEMTVASAHRSPARVEAYARDAAGRGIHVLIAGAGGAAHLAGVLAAHTTLPVIGIPLASSTLGGLDALLSTAQMPGGVPVATVGIGNARNAALLAVQILGAGDPALRERFRAYKARLASEVDEKAARLAMRPEAGMAQPQPAKETR